MPKVVTENGSIPAEQLARLGLRSGGPLSVVETSQPARDLAGLAGSLPDLAELQWEDFERGSELARGPPPWV